MAAWTLMPVDKKSIEEITYFVKDNNVVAYRLGWRGGSVCLLTSDDNPPEIDLDGNDELNVYDLIDDHIVEVELDSFWDGCWSDWEVISGEVSDEELEEMMEAYEENYDDGLAELGWENDEYEVKFYGQLSLERVTEN